MAQVSSTVDEQVPTLLSASKSILLRISKFNPELDESSKFMEFTVSYEKWTTVLEAILDVKKHFDHSELSFQKSQEILYPEFQGYLFCW